MIARYGLSGAIALAMLAVESPASAQAAPDAPVECILIGHLWSGTTADIAAIATVPVPPSYQREFFAGPCNFLIKSTLIDWHLAFGDEASTAAALGFLDTNMAGKSPFAANLAARITAARRDRNPDRVRALADQAHTYLFLARQYLRAAEFYGSPALLAQAAHYAAPAIAAVAASKARIDGANDGDAGSIEDNDDQADAVEIQLAVVRAQITRTAEDLDTATAMLVAKQEPFFATAAKEAYQHGDDFCDIGERSDLESYAKACREDEFDRRAIVWLHYRALLDIVAIDVSRDPAKAEGLTSLESVDAIVRIAHRDEQAHGRIGAGRYSPADDAEVALRIARADALTRFAGATPGQAYDAGRLLNNALVELMQAEALVPPTASPGRFRQIALRFLVAYDRAVAVEDRERPDRATLGNPVIDREAVYFRTMLPLLKPIAEGRVPR